MRIVGFALALFLVLPMAAQSALTGAGAATFATPAVLENVSAATMRFGIGVDLAADGTAAGDLVFTLVGARNVVVEGTVTSGSVNTVLGVTTLSGLCSIDPGDGTALRTGVPFTATVASGASTLTLVVGSTALPAAKVSSGAIRIR